jgi:hypothetical protein
MKNESLSIAALPLSLHFASLQSQNEKNEKKGLKRSKASEVPYKMLQLSPLDKLCIH